MLGELQSYAKNLLRQVGYTAPLEVVWGEDDTACTNGIVIQMPRTFYNLRFDVRKPSKKARQIAKGLIIHEIGHHLQPLRDIIQAVRETRINKHFENIAADVQLERVMLQLFPTEKNNLLAMRRLLWRKNRLDYFSGFKQSGSFIEQASNVALVGRFKRNKKPYMKSTKIDGDAITGQLKMFDLTMLSTPINAADLPRFIRDMANRFPDLCYKKPDEDLESDEDEDLESDEDEDLDQEDEDLESDEDEDPQDEDLESDEDEDPQDDAEGEPDADNLPDPLDEDNPALEQLKEAQTKITDLMQTFLVDIPRGRALPEAILLSKKLRLRLRKTQVSGKIIAPVKMNRRKMAIGDPQPWYDDRFTGKSINRSLTIVYDISASMYAYDRLKKAMIASQALCLAVEAERGSVCGGQFGEYGMLTQKLDAALLFAQPIPIPGKPRKDSSNQGGTSLKLLTKIWMERPQDQIIVITDGQAELPYTVKPEDKDRTYIIVLGEDDYPHLATIGTIHRIKDNELDKLPEIMLQIADQETAKEKK